MRRETIARQASRQRYMLARLRHLVAHPLDDLKTGIGANLPLVGVVHFRPRFSMEPRKNCSRCGCDLAASGIAYRERAAMGPEHLYCPTCAGVIKDMQEDFAKPDHFARLSSPRRTQASDTAAAEIVEWKRLGFTPKD